MRIAVMSDIHGNLEALIRCLNDIDRSSIDRLVNLGDAIGYGPQPEEVLVLLEKKGISNILGNHESAVIDRDFRSDFSPQAIISLEQTLKYLTSASFLYIKNLPCYRETDGALMVHGCPPGSPTIYLNHMSRFEIKETFVSNSFDIAFAGHTHRLMLMCYDGKDLTFDPLRQEVTPLKQGFRYIVNVGAVGQPRDGDPLAKYVIWDNRRKTLEIRRVAYDISRTANLIIKRGFLRRDADRLYTGDAPGPHQVYQLASCDR
jgi:predicted phosphodiesterase